MKLNKKIQRMIKKKMSFTNGWSIEEERYDKLVKELTNQIILTIEEEWNRRRHLSTLPSVREHNKDLTATQQVASPKSASQTSLNPDIKLNKFGNLK